MAELTDKQQRFVEEYLLDTNATQAAIRAGYKASTAGKVGPRTLNTPLVAKAIAEAQARRRERTEIDADWVLRRLLAEAEADIADLYDDNGSLKPVKEWPLIWRQGLVAGIDSFEEFETADGERVQTGVVKRIKQSDRLKRLEMLGKHLGMFVERVDMTLTLTDRSTEDLKSELAKVLAQLNDEASPD